MKWNELKFQCWLIENNCCFKLFSFSFPLGRDKAKRMVAAEQWYSFKLSTAILLKFRYIWRLMMFRCFGGVAVSVLMIPFNFTFIMSARSFFLYFSILSFLDCEWNEMNGYQLEN